MERLAQYWDDLDDLVYMIGLCREGLRRLGLFLLTGLLFVTMVSTGVVVALLDPPLALAIVTILLIFLMYQSVTEAGAAPAAG